jgi:4,5-dihydroxyphthalate decarboxylase
LEELRALFGGDPFVYGIEANAHTLSAMTRFSYEQGLSARQLDPRELFAPETLGWRPPPDRWQA